MAKKKDNPKIKAFLELLNQKSNNELLFKLRLKAGLPQAGIDWSKNGIDLSKHDIATITTHFGAYKAMLSHTNPKYFDIFISQDTTVNDFLLEYFIFNQLQDKTLEKVNPTGCEIFSLTENLNLSDHSIFLPKGVYLRIGTNNTNLNIKTFINTHSEKILNAQRKLSKEKPIRLKPHRNSFRDNFIFKFSKEPLKTLLSLAEKDGILFEVQNRLKNKTIEKKEIIMQVYIEKLFKEKLTTGAIRKIISGK